MSTRTVLVLFSIAVAVSVYARIFEQGAESWSQRGRLFSDLEPGDIVEMYLVHKDLEQDADRGVDSRPIRLRYEGTPPAWWVVEPIHFIGYHPRIQAIAYDLTEVASVAELAPEDAERRSAEAQIVLQFKTRQGDEHSIEILDDHAVAGFDFTYARVKDQTFAIPSRFRQRLSVSLTELRSRALVGLSSTDLVKVEIGGGERFSKTLARDSDSVPWRLLNPFDALADQELTEDLLVALGSWAIAGFVAESADHLAEYGLHRPQATVRVDSMDGRSVTLEIGSKVTAVPEGEREPEDVPDPLVYVRHAGQPFVYTAATAPLDNILEDVDAFRSRYLFQIGLEDIRKIRGEMDGRVMLLKNVVDAEPEGEEASRNAAESSWKARSIPSGEAPDEGSSEGWFVIDRAHMQSVLASLRRLLVQKFLPQALAAPRGKFDLHLSDGRKIEAQVGPLSTEPDDAGQNIYQVGVTGEPGSFLVSAALPAMLEKGADAFRARDISDLEVLGLHEMEIRDGETSWVLGRTAASAWLLSQDSPPRAGTELDSVLVEGFFLLLSKDRFRVKEFRSDITDYTVHRLELQNARRSVHFRKLGSDHRFRKLVLGDPLDATRPLEIPARVGDPEIPPFLLEADVVKEFGKLVDHLREITGA